MNVMLFKMHASVQDEYSCSTEIAPEVGALK